MTDRYDYTILGAGAVGCVFGGLLAGAGHSVQLVNRSADTARAIAQNGLVLELDRGDIISSPDAVQPAAVKPSRVVMVFTKAHQTAAALRSILGALDADTTYVSLQNGLGNGALVAETTGSQKVLHGVTMLPATLLSAGKVRSHGSSQTWIGPLTPENMAEADRVSQDLVAAGFDMVLTENPAVRIWQKACFNVALNGVCALTSGSPGLVHATPGLQDQAHALADEAIAVSKAEGVGIDTDAVHKLIDFACAGHTFHKPSMLQDIEAGRLTEIDSLNGYIATRAARHGIDVPLNRLITALVSARQSAPEFWQAAPKS